VYGEALIERLAKDLTARFGRGFSRQNLWQMRAFYQAWSAISVRRVLPGDGSRKGILQTVSGECSRTPGEAPGALITGDDWSGLPKAEARYALEGLPNKVLAAEYQTMLPDEKLLAEELARTRSQIEGL
jgi:hypothetical protein